MCTRCFTHTNGTEQFTFVVLVIYFKFVKRTFCFGSVFISCFTAKNVSPVSAQS
uniref:Uncharacterized protein n=1 Tax=Anopheles atroparvus TaxID=41427 RepID=A0AAG5D9B4_ANOAO